MRRGLTFLESPNGLKRLFPKSSKDPDSPAGLALFQSSFLAILSNHLATNQDFPPSKVLS